MTSSKVKAAVNASSKNISGLAKGLLGGPESSVQVMDENSYIQDMDDYDLDQSSNVRRSNSRSIAEEKQSSQDEYVDDFGDQDLSEQQPQGENIESKNLEVNLSKKRDKLAESNDNYSDEEDYEF